MMIADNLSRVRERIATACARVGRDPSDVTLVAVSKTMAAEVVLAAVSAGLQHFGENRVEEAEIKIPLVRRQVTSDLTWHMIGHIQSRKARDVVPLFQVVHSVDSLRLAGRLSAFALERDLRLPVLVECNVSGEESKYGFQLSGWPANPKIRERFWEEFGQLLALPGLRVQGLMTMAPIVDDPERTRPMFASLAALRADLSSAFACDLPELSMGMTDDFPVALEEGATLVRIGRAIFGDRTV